MTALGSSVFEYSLVEETPNADKRVIEKIHIGQVIQHGAVHLVRMRGTRMNKKKDPALTTTEISPGNTVSGNVQLFPSLALEGLKILAPDGSLLDFPEWASEVKVTLGPVIVAQDAFTITGNPDLTLPAGYYQSILSVT